MGRQGCMWIGSLSCAGLMLVNWVSDLEFDIVSG